MTLFEQAPALLAAPERPPLALRRIHLRSVGPRDARFDPLDLRHEAPDGSTAARVLWTLTNTGGKTTILRLATSVVVPGAREQMGRANIGEYVQTGDTAHIVLEWDHAADGHRFVTGAVYEWPGRKRPPGTPPPVGELRRWFYTFRCSGLGIDDLPFSDDRRRRTLEEFRNELSELFRDRPEARYLTARTFGEWARVLDEATPLDPELFRYQMRMNDDEAGAEALIHKLTTPETIVRFFIEALNDDDSLASFGDTLADYARHAAQRGAWTTEAEFCQALVTVLEPLAEAHHVRAEARREAALALERAGELAGTLEARIAAEIIALSEMNQRLDSIRDEAGRLDYEIGRQSDLRRQLQLEDARFEVHEAEQALAAASEARTRAEREQAAWAATDPVAAWRAAQAAAAESQAAYERAEGELLPLRKGAMTAGARLAAAYAGLATEAESARRRAQADLDASHAAREDAASRIKAALRAEEQAHGRLRVITDAIDAAGRALDRLRASGHAGPNETATGARARWETETDAIAQRQVALDAHASRMRSQRDEAARAVGAARQAHAEVDRVARDLIGRLADYRADLASTAADDNVATASNELVGGPITDIRIAAAVADHCQTRASAAERTAADTDADLREAEAQLARLERGDLLATSADIEAVRALLGTAGIGAVTGWEWLDRNVVDVDERRRRIATHPDLANGVIVTDPARLADARALVDQAVLDTKIAVLVAPSTTAANPSMSDVGSDGGFVIEPHRALWDRAWAERARDETRARRDLLAERTSVARTNATRFRAAHARLAELVRRWPAEQVDALPLECERARAACDAAANQLTEVQQTLEAAEAELDAAQQEMTAVVHAAADVRVRLEACRHAADLEEHAAETEKDRPDAEDAATAARSDLDAADAARTQADADAADAQARIARAEAQRDRYRSLQGDVGVEPADEIPDAPAEELRAVWEQLRSDLAAAEAGSDHAARLDETRKRAAAARVRVDTLEESMVAAAEHLLATFEGSNTTLRVAALKGAERNLRAAERRYAEIDVRATSARGVLGDRTPTDRQAYYRLEGEWTVASRADVAERLKRVDARSAAERARLTELLTHLRGLEDEAARAAVDRERFETALRGLAVEATPGMAAYVGTSSDALDAAQEANAQRRGRDGDATAAEDLWREALNKVRTTVGATRWASLESPWKERCQHGSADQLGAEAAAWARILSIRGKSLRDDIANLDRHRDVLVTNLDGLCNHQLRLLHKVTRASRLPDGMGELSGQAAFQIEFDKAAPNEGRARLAARVDRWASDLAADPKKATRDQRYRWLAEATRDLVIDRPKAGAWTVQVLKPNIDGTVEYRTPDRIAPEFSGGQELTLAVLLYCTLSAVRAENRTAGPRPPGVLLLDNPFGPASNGALIRVQHALAARAGLQLVCATGLTDAAVKTSFEGADARLLELRNDRDQRHGMRYLRIRDPDAAAVVLAALAGGRDASDGAGYLDGTSYTIRRT